MKLAQIGDYLENRPAQRALAVDPNAYTDPAIFELEQRHIFAKTWAFLTIESQIERPHDYVTTHIASSPILVSRAKDGSVNAFLNACRHKGALICVYARGNARVHVCPYHAWTYDSAGKLVGIRDQSTGGYSEAFKESNHNLIPLPRVESYRGFVFGSLSADVPPLADFLGDMRFFIDLIVDRYPQGLEFVPGTTSYTYRGNWKLQLENGMDAYHLNTAHKTFLDIVKRRRDGEGSQQVKEIDWGAPDVVREGIYSFEYGHTVLWRSAGSTSARPDNVAAEQVRAQVGDTRADWMQRGRVHYFFPNMQIQDFQSLMLRVFRPLAVDLTEMNTYCLAPIGESDELRSWRLRQYEDFFNPAGLATPDDSVIYQWCQEGFRAQGLPLLQGFARGAGELKDGGNEMSEEINISPVMSCSGPAAIYGETGPFQPYRIWQTMLARGIAADREGVG